MSSSSGFEAQTQGRIGEGELQRLANEGDLIPIRADPDLTGWDFCVEERESSSSAPLDCRPPPLKFMVQVKTVSSSELSPSISLANWERMVKDPLPWFVLIVRVEDRKPTTAYLIHIGRMWIERTLERLTREAARGEPGDLNRKKMSIKWRSEDRIEPREGPTFASMLRRHAGVDPAFYAADKRRLVDSVGYEGVSVRGQFRVSFDDLDRLAAFAVGERAEFPVQDFTRDRVRFGIPIREVDGEDGFLTHTSSPVADRARVIVVRDATGARCTLECSGAVASDMFPVPPDRDRVVLEHPVVKISMDFSSQYLSLTYWLPQGFDVAVPIRDIGPASELVAALTEAVGNARIEIHRDGRPPVVGELTSAAKHLAALKPQTAPLANAWAIARRAGLEEVPVIPRELVAQQKQLFAARAAIENWPGITAVVRVRRMPPMREGSTAALGSVAVRLGENVCVLGVSCAGPGRLDTQPDGTPVITIENGVLRAHGFRTVSLEEFRTRVSELQKELDERTRAEIDAAGAVNLFLPAPFDAA